jgi:uncharacterized protein (DUF39 family)
MVHLTQSKSEDTRRCRNEQSQQSAFITQRERKLKMKKQMQQAKSQVTRPTHPEPVKKRPELTAE